MRKDIFTIFNIEVSEKTSVLLFLIQSVFLGIFYGAFDVGAHALFLSAYPASMIPKAYVISGIAGIILTTIYARIQSKYKFSTLAIINLLFISISTALLRVLFQFTESSWLVFLIFIMMGPLNIIALLGFWGAVGRMFSLRQGKRLFGLIDSGQIFGAILSTFAIPILISVGFEQKNLLFLSSVSVMCAFFMQIIISFKFNLNVQVHSTDIKKRKRLPELLKNKYVRHMSVFVVMSMLAAFFIQFSFLSVAKDNYADHNDLAEFLGAFTGTLLLFTFLFKTFLYSKLMKTYGLKVSILISSFLLGIFTVLAVLIGSLAGYTSASGSFIFFFLIISLSRLFSKVLKDAVEVPSFKILYQSLKAEIRHDVQAYVDGTINEIAALSAGLLLMVLSFFEFFKLIHFSYSLLIILGFWFLIARKLYNEYKVSLQKTLAEHKGVKEDIESVSNFVDKNLENAGINPTGLITGLEMDFEISPLRFEKKIKDLVDFKDETIKKYAVNKVLDYKLVDSFSELSEIRIKKEIENNNVSELWQNFDLKINKSPGIEKMISLSKSKGTDERILAAWLMGKFFEPELYVYLKALIRDLQVSVKIAAFKASVNTKKTEFCSLICDYLDTPDLVTYAYDSLLKFGEPALASVDQLFYKTGASHRILLRVVKLIGEIGGDKAIELLVNKLDHPNEEILNQVLTTLNKAGFKASVRHLILLNQILEKHIGVMSWNIAAKSTIEEVQDYDYLKDAIDEELKANYSLLYLLLSLAYDSKSVMHVKENIESGTAESTSYALELLDLFIDEEIKPKLFPIVEDISVLEKIRQLQNFYPIEKLSLNDLLISIINRDINLINIWTKTCAIYAFSENETTDLPLDLLAHIFNPNEILRETAGVVVNSIDSENYQAVSKRLNLTYKEELDSSIELLPATHNHLLVEKTWFLKSIEYFKNVDGRYLYELAQVLHTLRFDTYSPEDIIVSDIKDKILILKGDSAELILDDEITIDLTEGKLYDMNDILKNSKRKIALKQNENSWIYYIEKRDLIYNMFDFYKIESSVIKWLANQFNTEKIT